MHNIIIGETCLLSYQLRRLGIVSDAKDLFENMLVNLDGVRAIISDDFNFLIDTNYLNYEHYVYYPDHNIGYPKWINKKYTLDNDNIFSWPVCSFFHYDSFNSSQVESIKRKVLRFKNKLEDKKAVNFYYYYRWSPNFNIETFKDKAEDFIAYVSKKYNKDFKLTVITKKDVKYKSIQSNIKNNITYVEFSSPFSWIYIDDNWNGSSDNELFDISNL